MLNGHPSTPPELHQICGDLGKMRLADELHRPSNAMCRTLQLLLLSLTTFIIGTQGQSCASNTPVPETVASKINFQIGTAKCQDVWTKYSFTLRFNQNLTTNTLGVVLSVPTGTKRWYGIGFNKQSQMVGSSAVVAWVDETTRAATILPYYLADQKPSQVTVDHTRLVFTADPVTIDTADNFYMAFEIDGAKSTAGLTNQVLAVGYEGQIPTSNNVLQEHQDKIAIALNYQEGSVVVIEDNTPTLARNHGLLNIFGWGVLLPIGAIIARYARGYDPTWFYAHGIIQGIGYILVIAGLVTGFQVGDKVSVDYGGHQALGVVVFVMASIQVTAVLIRPRKDAKIRRYWNWGHWWIGRLGLFLAAINIFVGINVASASTRWKAGYAIVLALEIVLVMVLETILWITYLRNRDGATLPQTAMQRRDAAYDTSPRAPPPPYESPASYGSRF